MMKRMARLCWAWALFIIALIAHPGLSLAENKQPLRFLNHNVTDAEYSKQMDRIITVSSTPKEQLHVYDPIDHKDDALDLHLPPTCVSVSPDGRYAAVGHDGWISYVELAGPVVLKTIPVSTYVGDIVLAGNGYAYAFSRFDWYDVIHSINLESEEETLSGDYIVKEGNKIKLHPSGKAIYGADNQP